MKADVQLRLMREQDLPAYKVLRDQMLARHEEAFTSDAATEITRSADSYRSRLSGVGGSLFTLMAWREETLVGAVSCEREGRAKVRHIAHVVGMMVDDAAQGQRIGRTLLQKALQLLRHDGDIQLVTLSVTAGNQRALRLYESLGFVRYGCLEGALHMADGRWLDKVLMALRLPRA